MHYFFLACILACAPYHANSGVIGSKTMLVLLIGVAIILMFTPETETSALSIQGQQSQQKQKQGGDSVDGTAQLTPDEIAFLDSLGYLEIGDIEAAYAVLEASFQSSARNPDPERRLNRLSQRKISLGGGTTFTSEYKIRQDIEQAQYLAETLSYTDRDPEKAEFFASVVLPVYRTLLSNIPPLEELNETMGLYKFQRSDVDYGIMGVYNRALHVPDVPATRQDGTPIPIFAESLNPSKIQQDWVDSDGIVVVDDILSRETLDLIREKILWESTVWYQTKLPQRFGGYTGAYIDDGLHQRILLELSVSLRKLLPDIFDGHPLKYMWAYKCESFSGMALFSAFVLGSPGRPIAFLCAQYFSLFVVPLHHTKNRRFRLRRDQPSRRRGSHQCQHVADTQRSESRSYQRRIGHLHGETTARLGL